MQNLAVVGLLSCQNKTLLLHRTSPPICWCPPGGHVEKDETIREAVLREVYEETGIYCKIVMPVDVWNGMHNASVIESISFICECDTPEVKLSCEHDDFRWIDISKIETWQHDTDFQVKAWNTFFKTAQYFKNLIKTHDSL